MPMELSDIKKQLRRQAGTRRLTKEEAVRRHYGDTRLSVETIPTDPPLLWRLLLNGVYLNGAHSEAAMWADAFEELAENLEYGGVSYGIPCLGIPQWCPEAVR